MNKFIKTVVYWLLALIIFAFSLVVTLVVVMPTLVLVFCLLVGYLWFVISCYVIDTVMATINNIFESL